MIRVCVLILFCGMLAGSRLTAENSASPKAAAGGTPSNPIAASPKSIALGRKLYEAHCMACHGKGGKGDGDAAISLPRRVSDLSQSEMSEESDDDIFSVITNGRRPMPKFAKLLSEDQRWHIINYIRTLAH